MGIQDDDAEAILWGMYRVSEIARNLCFSILIGLGGYGALDALDISPFELAWTDYTLGGLVLSIATVLLHQFSKKTYQSQQEVSVRSMDD